MVYYITTLLVYAGVDAIACLGLSQQFGIGGVTNFGFIIFQAAGAYAAAVLSLPSSSANGGFQSYIGGLNLPLPVPMDRSGDRRRPARGAVHADRRAPVTR